MYGRGYIFKTLFTLLLLLVFQQAGFAGISVLVNNRPLSLQQAPVQYYGDSSADHRFNRFITIRPFLKNMPGGNISMSYKDKQFWISMDIAALPISDSIIYLEIHNPHINYLGVWLLNDDSLVESFSLTGDHLPFATRNIFHPQFVYKLSLAKKKGLRLLLLVDKRNEQLHLPVNFFSEASFIQSNRSYNLLAGALTGVAVFILLFSFFLYFNVKDRAYLFYGIYVTFVAAYIFTDFGLSFMFFYPGTPGIADFVRPFTLSLVPVFYILFASSLLDVKKLSPKLHRLGTGYIIIYLSLFVSGFLILPNTGAFRIFWLMLMQVVISLSIIPVFIFGWAAWRVRVKYAVYVLFASLVFTVFSQVYMQYITGNLPDNFVTSNAMTIGFSIEIALLTLALSIRFKNYKQDAEKLLKALNMQQENIFKLVSEYQEKEMNRLAGMLHDSIGAGLSAIKFNLETISHDAPHHPILKNTIDDITTLADEVRTISHNMSPVLLQKKGLIQALKDLVHLYNRTGRINICLEFIGSLQVAGFQNELLVYRIVQELLQNAIRHGHATEITVQVILEPELISLFIEDDGRGFDERMIKDGLGFSQIRGLITFVNGSFHLDSAVNKGCRVSIEFPVISHERTDQSTAGG